MCASVRVLQRYSFNEAEPASKRKAARGTIATQLRCLVQSVQVHWIVPRPRSTSSAKRTAPQWQLPWRVRRLISVRRLRLHHRQLDEAAVVDALGGLFIVGRLGKEDVGYEGL